MTLPAAAIIDVDGSLVDVSSVRHHVDGSQKRNFDAFHRESAGCPPIAQTLAWVEELHDAGHHILIVTARMEKWRGITERWLGQHLTRPHTDLLMRRDGDYRKDYTVKREIHASLASSYDIRVAVDDNPHVLELWSELGIPVRVVPGWPG